MKKYAGDTEVLLGNVAIIKIFEGCNSILFRISIAL